tara:strand:- start:9533 stop:11593 length:2061 start_codon:yes stop_codon:yes gene_type:complete
MHTNKVTGDPMWIAESSYHEKDLVKMAKFWWNNGTPSGKFKVPEGVPHKVWWTPDIDKAVILIDYTEGDTKEVLVAHLANINQRLQDSVATDSDMIIPIPDGLEYYPYQKAGIAFGSNNNNVLIADEMGLGKTIQSIGILNYKTSLKRALIVVPASLKVNWKKELAVWSTRDLSVAVVNSTDGKKKTLVNQAADIIIVNYASLISKKLEWLNDIDFDVIIADEVHKVKNNTAKRSKKFYELAKKIDHKIYLSGTPMLNRPVELFHIINSLGFDMNFMAYAKRYCNATKEQFGWDMSGSSNLEELQLELRKSFMIRRMKANVLTELPPKRRQIIELDASKYQDLIDQEDTYLMVNGIDIKQSKEEKIFNNKYDEKVDGMKGYTAMHIAEMARLRKATAVAKIDDVVKHIVDSLESVDKIIVFAHHREVVEGITDALIAINGDPKKKIECEPVKLYGGMTQEAKDESVERFQNDDRIKVFVGSIMAAGVGLTLTAASLVVFAELDWVPANLTQAEDRAHRIGQTDSVMVQHLVIEGSLDVTLAKRVVGKQNVIDLAMKKEHVDRFRAEQKATVIKLGEESNQMIEAAKKRVEGSIAKAADYKAQRKAKDVTDGIPEYTPEQRKSILEQVQFIASRCDGANAQDGQGFNGMDTGFGKSMAELETMSNRQAFYTEKMLKKYHGQLEHMGV